MKPETLIKELVKALTEYHRANRLHHDEDARLYHLSEKALKKAERWSKEKKS